MLTWPWQNLEGREGPAIRSIRGGCGGKRGLGPLRHAGVLMQTAAPKSDSADDLADRPFSTLRKCGGTNFCMGRGTERSG
jgi:hypothetical protein